MATRSTIALEYADGTVDQIYCHWDGYLDHNGKILATHYMDPYKVRDLVDMGDVSSLGKEIGKKRPFCPAYNEQDPVKRAAVQAEIDAADKAGWTIFYARDRGETCPARKFKDYADYVANHQYEEYEYILRNVGGTATWFVDDHGRGYVPLLEAMTLQEEEVAE